MAADERVTGFVERLAEKWANTWRYGLPVDQTVGGAIRDALTEAARVARAHNIAIGTEAAERVAREIERMRDE